MSKGKELIVAGSGKSFVEKFKGGANEMLCSYFGQPQKVARFYSAIKMCFAKNPKLKECSISSLSTVFMTCAEVGLYPSSYTGECYVIPYKIKGEMTATFQLGYQGMVTLAYKAGVRKIDAQVVYANDKFTYKIGLNPVLDHEVDILSSDRGEAIGAYAIAILESGETIFKYMSKADIFKHRAKSQGWQSDEKYNGKSSPWQPENDPQLTMWSKTAFRQLYKLIPKSVEMQQAEVSDLQGDIIDMKSEPVSDNPTQDDLAAFVNEAVEYLSEAGNKDASNRSAIINQAIIEITGDKKLEGITADQLHAIKAKIYTPEESGDGEQGKLI